MARLTENPALSATDSQTPIEVWTVMLDNSTIKFNKPLIVKPEILPPEAPGDNTYLTVDIPELNISAHGLNHEELRDSIESCISFGWRHYVQSSDCLTSPEIEKIKHNYLNLAEEVFDE